MTIYEQYAILNAKIEQLETEKTALRVSILEDMIKRGVEKEETSIGSFKKTTIKTWTYTPKVKELEDQFKAEKAKEQSTGEATFEENASLRFTGIKI